MITAGTYRHYKGNLYTVIGIAEHTETTEEMVVYVSAGPDGKLWVRPLDVFAGYVHVAGTTVLRFERVGGSTSNPYGNL